MEGVAQKIGLPRPFEVLNVFGGKSILLALRAVIFCEKQVSREMYKLIFVDYCMQGMDGPEVAQKIRKMLDEENIEQPFICCCTAYVEETY